VAATLGCTVGVAARDLGDGRSVLVDAAELFPMASCFKVPVMVEVLRRVDAGDLGLDRRLTLRERDKSPGSTLLHCDEGLRLTVKDLLYLMITLSDNTATDMLWRLVGLDAVNAAMRALGLSRIDCRMPDREYYLLECGLGSEWRGLDGAQVVAHWRELEERGEEKAALARVLAENARLSGAQFQRRYDECWGPDESAGYDDAFAVDQALDNMGSPGDMAELLAMIVEGRCASAAGCGLMLEILSRQQWREKIPAGLPPGLRVANKTGGVTGTSNDAAIVYTPSGRPLVMVVYLKGLPERSRGQASAAIAGIAGALYEYFEESA
jgi:beta-lactamase class A